MISADLEALFQGGSTYCYLYYLYDDKIIDSDNHSYSIL